MDVVPSEPLAQQLAMLPPRAIVKMLIEGTEEEPGPIATALNETGFVLPPLPHLHRGIHAPCRALLPLL